MNTIELAVPTSIKDNIWLLKQYDEHFALTLAQKYSLDEITARLLSLRQIPIQEVEDYLHPTIKSFLPDPFGLKDMEVAAERIVKAITNKENIVIFGDYDVDGATSSALLKRFLQSLGVNPTVYIPDRIKEGYGPSVQAMHQLKQQNAQVIITVDCGTAAFAALEAAKDLNLEVIVIDHHLSSQQLPPALGIVNPNRFDETSNYKYLAAVGVCFLFAVAINSKLTASGFFNHHKKPNLLALLDLVALGTVCDVVPLEGLNRALVVQGLKILKQRSNLGIKILLDTASIIEQVNCYHLGFIVGPRINAGGRVGESDLGSTILASDDVGVVSEIAQKLNHYNAQRKDIEQLVLTEAIAQAELIPPTSAVIVVYSNNWHPGVIGIVASRLKDKFNKPTAVISITENAIGKASCRSIKGIDFGSAIFAAKNQGLLKEGGGHAMAGGFSVELEKIPALTLFFNELFAPKLLLLNEQKNHFYDAHLSCASVNAELIHTIEKLGPYGAGAPEPRFRLNNCYVIKVDIIAGAHISCIIAEDYGKKSLKATAFRATDSALGDFLLTSRGKKIDIIGYLRLNRWNGLEKAEVSIEDVIAR
jgi:single-stranded-DNA-specific exonuclease